ncbi:MAG: hypothetical protein ACYDC3_16520 [Candidatus Binataceae bacterium]
MIPNSTKLMRYFFTRRRTVRLKPLGGSLPAISLAALAAVFVLGATIGCNKSPAPRASAPAVQPVALGPDEPTKALPPDMFKATPIYPGSTVEHVRRPKGEMREIVFLSDATMPALVAYFKDQLKKNGFYITSSLIMPARRTWSCDFHKQGRPGSLMVYPSDADKSKMTIDLIYEMPSKVDESLLEPLETFDVEGPGEVAQQAPNPKPSTKQN